MPFTPAAPLPPARVTGDPGVAPDMMLVKAALTELRTAGLALVTDLGAQGTQVALLTAPLPAGAVFTSSPFDTEPPAPGRQLGTLTLIAVTDAQFTLTVQKSVDANTWTDALVYVAVASGADYVASQVVTLVEKWVRVKVTATSAQTRCNIQAVFS